MPAGASDGELVEQLEKGGVEPLQQLAGLAFGAALSRPGGENLLSRSKGFLETADAECFGKSLVAAFGQEIELVAQVFQVVVHRRC